MKEYQSLMLLFKKRPHALENLIGEAYSGNQISIAYDLTKIFISQSLSYKLAYDKITDLYQDEVQLLKFDPNGEKICELIDYMFNNYKQYNDFSSLIKLTNKEKISEDHKKHLILADIIETCHSSKRYYDQRWSEEQLKNIDIFNEKIIKFAKSKIENYKFLFTIKDHAFTHIQNEYYLQNIEIANDHWNFIKEYNKSKAYMYDFYATSLIQSKLNEDVSEYIKNILLSMNFRNKKQILANNECEELDFIYKSIYDKINSKNINDFHYKYMNNRHIDMMIDYYEKDEDLYYRKKVDSLIIGVLFKYPLIELNQVSKILQIIDNNYDNKEVFSRHFELYNRTENHDEIFHFRIISFLKIKASESYCRLSTSQKRQKKNSYDQCMKGYSQMLKNCNKDLANVILEEMAKT